MLKLLETLIEITTDVVKIAAAPVEVAADVVKRTIKPIAEEIEDWKEGLKDKG